MTRSSSGRRGMRRTAVFGTALATAACSAGVLTASAPHAFAATAACGSAGTSSSLTTSKPIEPTGGTTWKILKACGSAVDIQLTAAVNDSYLGILYDTQTKAWVECHNGTYQKWKGSTLTLCTDVLATTKFAVIQKSSTHRSITVSYPNPG